MDTLLVLLFSSSLSISSSSSSATAKAAQVHEHRYTDQGEADLGEHRGPICQQIDDVGAKEDHPGPVELFLALLATTTTNEGCGGRLGLWIGI